MADRFTHKDFKEEYLIALAQLTNGDPDKIVKASAPTAGFKDQFNPSWVNSAGNDLNDHGYVKFSRNLNGDGNIRITGSGIEQAEEWANERGFDLWEDQEGDIDSQDDREIPEGQIVGIDHLAPLFKSLQEDLQGSLTHVKANNEFMATAGAEGARRISEVESGMHLLKSEQVDVNLVQRLILGPLKWILTKISDEALSMIINATIVAVVAWLASKGISLSL